MTDWINVASADDVPDEDVLGVVAEGIRIALFRLEDEIFALHDLCSHGQAFLSEGFVEDGCVECPLHQGLIDIRTGAARSAPITDPVRSFPTRIVEGRVEVAL